MKLCATASMLASIVALGTRLVAGNKLVTSLDGVEHMVPDTYEDRAIVVPSGEVITVRLYGNLTRLPGPAIAPPPPPKTLLLRAADRDKRGVRHPTADARAAKREWIPTNGGANECGDENQWICNTSGNSPAEADCAEMAYAVSFELGYWRFTPSDVGLNYLTVVTRNTCAFGFGLGPASCLSVNLGNTDISDLIHSSISKCAYLGQLGANGDQLYCNSDAPGQVNCWTKWAIYHT